MVAVTVGFGITEKEAVTDEVQTPLEPTRLAVATMIVVEYGGTDINDHGGGELVVMCPGVVSV